MKGQIQTADDVTVVTICGKSFTGRLSYFELIKLSW